MNATEMLLAAEEIANTKIKEILNKVIDSFSKTNSPECENCNGTAYVPEEALVKKYVDAGTNEVFCSLGCVIVYINKKYSKKVYEFEWATLKNKVREFRLISQ